MSDIRGWYLEGIDYRDAPINLRDLEIKSKLTIATRQELIATDKWEHLLHGKRSALPEGWVFLEELASTRRGIATGANSFFLLTEAAVKEADIRLESIAPCVGRASDVEHFIFTAEDFKALGRAGGKTQLLNFKGKLSKSEARYIDAGERQGLMNRYLLANRSPWYSMEQREVAAVWAAVFGRGDLKFVYNAAAVRSLTNFHCLYPVNAEPDFARALTFCLNTPTIRSMSKLHTRIYGGGLSKFEPNDLKQIPIPDLRRISKATLRQLSQALDLLDAGSRASGICQNQTPGDELVTAAGEEARGSCA